VRKKKKYNPRKYNPSSGGHAPEHLRQAFVEYFMELGATEELTLDSTLSEDHGYPFTLREIIGLLWNCTDILPALAYQELQDWGLEFNNRTYGAAVRALKADLI